MKIINRGYILIKPKQGYWNWANTMGEPEVHFSEADDSEGSIYLVEEDFFDIEPLLEQQFKKIFKNELLSVSDDESTWPEKLTMDLFLDWFSVDYGSTVFDLEKADLKAEKLD